MKNSLILLISILIYQNTLSQDIYFNVGKNFTSYDYKTSADNLNYTFQKGTGSYYELGYSKTLDSSNFVYSIGISLNQYNSLGGDSANNYTWDTDYLGIQGMISYIFFTQNSLKASIGAGLNFNTIIYGKQEINGEFYDLVSEKEFSGLILQPKVGLQVKYDLSRFGYLCLGYNISKSYHPFNSNDEKLSFNNSQLQFGIHFNI